MKSKFHGWRCQVGAGCSPSTLQFLPQKLSGAANPRQRLHRSHSRCEILVRPSVRPSRLVSSRPPLAFSPGIPHCNSSASSRSQRLRLAVGFSVCAEPICVIRMHHSSSKWTFCTFRWRHESAWLLHALCLQETKQTFMSTSSCDSLFWIVGPGGKCRRKTTSGNYHETTIQYCKTLWPLWHETQPHWVRLGVNWDFLANEICTWLDVPGTHWEGMNAFVIHWNWR